MTQASHKAHEKIKLKAGSIKKQILWLLDGNRYTCDDLRLKMGGVSHETTSARLTELHADGLISPCGERRGHTVYRRTLPNEIEAVKASVEAERFQRDLKRMKRYRHMPGFEEEIEKLKAA